MKRKIRPSYDGHIYRECSEYTPIQALHSIETAFEDRNDTEDAGCDSCIHSNHGLCEIYKEEHTEENIFQ